MSTPSGQFDPAKFPTMPGVQRQHVIPDQYKSNRVVSELDKDPKLKQIFNFSDGAHNGMY